MRKVIFGTILTLVIFAAVNTVSAASFTFSPANGSLVGECDSSINIEVDASGQSSSTADIEINFNTSQVTILDSDPDMSGTQTKKGNAYESYLYNLADNGTGKIKITAASFSSFLTSKKTLATIEFKSKPGVGATTFTIKFDGVGATLDSNIADSTTSNDLLTSVGSGSYTFINKSCASDTQAPIVDYVTPEPFTSGVDLNSNIVIKIDDALSGVDLNSLIFNIGGQLYYVGDAGVSYVGNANSYTFTINPTTNFPADEEVIMTVTGQDLAGNQFSSQAAFNIPLDKLQCEVGGNNNVTKVINNIFSTGADGKTVAVFNNTPLKGSVIDNVTTATINTLGPEGVSAVSSGFVLGLTLLPFLHLLNTPSLLVNLFGVLLGYKRKKPWGLIIDAVDAKPVAFANCRLFLSGTTTQLNQTVSDLEGRYGFAIRPGAYRLEVSKPNYQTFITEINVREGEAGYVYDVKLIPNKLSQDHGQGFNKKLRNYLGNLFEQFKKFLFGLGFLLSIIVLVYKTNALSIATFLIYVILGIFYVTSRLNRRARYAAVIDAETNLRVPFAMVKIFNPNSWELVDTQITNDNGQFDYWGDEGEYALLVAVRGYKFPSKKNTLPTVQNKYNALLKAFLRRGKNQINIYIDPAQGEQSISIENSPAPENNTANPAANPGISNLPSPFN